MGIRIHKAIGYGLVDFESDLQGNITDPRINPETKAIESFGGPTVKDYLESLDRRVSDGVVEEHEIWLAKLNLPKEKSFISEAVTFSHDYMSGDDEVREKTLVITPVSMLSSWKRSDDPIDYAEDFIKVEEENLDGQDLATKVHVFQNGHYPWNGIFMNAKDGERIEHKLWDVWKTFDRYYSSEEPGEKDTKENCEAVLEKTAKEMGFENIEEARENIVPWVPTEVRWLVEELELFSEPNGYRHLRPMFYSFWG